MLLGPLTLVLDVSPENQLWGIVFTILCVAALHIALIRPRQWSLGLATLALLFWLFIGLMGVGINC